jgi:hypothetical protein
MTHDVRQSQPGKRLAEQGLRPSTVAAILAASGSGAAILLHALHWMTLSYSIIILAPLTVILLAAALVRWGRGREEVLLGRLQGGLIAGVFGLIAYDLIRLAILGLGVVGFNPFRPIEVFGLLILDRYQDTTLTKVVGWSFHIWNGLSFAAMYTLAVGPGRLLWAVLWAMMLEATMIATYPSMFRVALDVPFLVVSFVGHLAYGLAIGEAARRVVSC